MRKYFKGINEKASDGWMLAVVSGYSNIDNQDWIIDTNSLHADQVPVSCMDAKTFSQLVSGLLNYYYNDNLPKEINDEYLIELGTVKQEEKIPSPLNSKLPF